jgi:hypothetical protein
MFTATEIELKSPNNIYPFEKKNLHILYALLKNNSTRLQSFRIFIYMYHSFETFPLKMLYIVKSYTSSTVGRVTPYIALNEYVTT